MTTRWLAFLPLAVLLGAQPSAPRKKSGVSLNREQRLAAELGDLAGQPLDITGFGVVSSADYRTTPCAGIGVRVREKMHGRGRMGAHRRAGNRFPTPL